MCIRSSVRGFAVAALLLPLVHSSAARAQVDSNGDGTEDVVSTKKPADPLSEPVVIEVWDRATQSVLLTIEGPAGEPGFGYSVAGAGDINADGVSDILVGSPGAGGSFLGRAEVFSGADGSSLLSIDDPWTVATGWFVGGVGDFDGDGVPDVFVSSHGAGLPDLPDGEEAPGTAADCGCDYPACTPLPSTINSGADGSVIAVLKRLEGPTPVSEVTALGDINGDGHGDFAVTYPTDFGFDGARGYVAVFYGRDVSQGAAALFAETADMYIVNDDVSLTHFGASLIRTEHDGDPALLVTSLIVNQDGSVTRDYRQWLLDPADPAVVWSAQQSASELAGDVDRDLIVTAEDAALILQDLAGAEPDGDPFGGDANGDGVVDEFDLLIVLDSVGMEDVSFAVFGFQGEIEALGSPGVLAPQTYAEMYHKLTPVVEEANAVGGGSAGLGGLCGTCLDPEDCDAPIWCPDPPCDDDCPDPPCEPDPGECDEYVCLEHGSISIIETTVDPEAAKTGETITWTIEAEDSGGSKICAGTSEIIEIPPAGVSFTWEVTKPDGEVVSGSGAAATINADLCGAYACTFTASADRECPPGEVTADAPGSVALPGVTFIPDEDTHDEDAEALMVLPGDVETVTALVDPEAECTGEPDVARYEIADTSVAKFLVDDELVTEIVIEDEDPPLGSFAISGLASGTTTLKAIGSDESVCGEIDIKVGGTVRIEYSSVPTVAIPEGAERGQSAQAPEYDGGYAPAYDPGFYDSGPRPLGGAPVGSGYPEARATIPDSVLQRMWDAGAAAPRNGVVTVTILDAEGEPKRNRPVALHSRHDFVVLSPEPGGSPTPANGGVVLSVTDDEGQVVLELAANHDVIVPNVDLGVWRDELGLVVGRDAAVFGGEDLDFEEDAQSIYEDGDHSFIDYVSLFETAVGEDAGLDDPFLISFELPLLNQAQVALAEHILVAPAWIDPVSPASPQWGVWEIPVLQLPQEEYVEETFYIEPSWILAPATWASVNAHRVTEAMEFAIENQVNPRLAPFGTQVDVEIDPGEVVEWTAFLGELGLGFVPGWDLVDVVRYGCIAPIFNDEGASTSDWVIASVAFIGLCADAGYLSGPGGLASNAVTSSAKAVVKKIPRSWLDEGFTSGREFVALLFELLFKGVPPGGSATDYALFAQDQISVFSSSMVRLTDGPLNISAQAGADTLRTLERNFATRMASDQAAEGVGGLIQHGGGEAAVDSLALTLRAAAGGTGSVADDSIDSVTSAIGKTYKRSPAGNGTPDLSDLRRVEDAIAAVGRQIDPHLRSYVTPHVGPGKPFKSMEEFEALRFQPAESLRPEQVTAIRAIRDAIPAPTVGTPMQKVIKGSEINQAIAENWNIRGFVAKQSDAGSDVLQNSDEMIDGLRLDGPAGFDNETSVGIIEWDLDAAPEVETPYGPGFSGNPTVSGEYPFTGNGLVASRNGRLTPEYRTTGGNEIIPPEGAKLFELDSSGQKTLRAVFQSGSWVTP